MVNGLFYIFYIFYIFIKICLTVKERMTTVGANTRDRPNDLRRSALRRKPR